MGQPDRIWADLNMGLWLDAPQPNRRPEPPTEYVRADLVPETDLMREIVEALEPFAKRADDWAGNGNNARVSVRLRDLRRAEAVLTKIIWRL